MRLPDDRGPLEHLYSLHIPNCDKNGLYNLKQVSVTASPGLFLPSPPVIVSGLGVEWETQVSVTTGVGVTRRVGLPLCPQLDQRLPLLVQPPVSTDLRAGTQKCVLSIGSPWSWFLGRQKGDLSVLEQVECRLAVCISRQ